MIQTPALVILKFEQWFYHEAVHPKDADKIENIVDPDQIAPWSSTLFD